MQIPEDLLYTQEHEWVREVEGGLVRIGITDYAQDQLGDVVYVELPEVGREIAKDDVLVEVESTKSVGEVYAPFAGKIEGVNDAIAGTPELVNQSPYEDGWLVLMRVEGELPTEMFLDATGYRELTE